MAEREKLIELKDLQISFGTGRKKFVAVDHVNFDIYKGETFSLVGESGSGKTTIGRAILRINPTSAGDIYFKGQKINGKISKELDTEVIRKCQMIFQDPMASLNERAKVDYIVSEGLINFHLYKDEKEREEKVQKVLREVGLLPEFASRFPHEFSGGQRQRVALGRAIVREPQVFLLDEPLSNLDAKLRAQMRTELAKLHLRLGTTFIYVTHDQTEAMTMGTRIVVMKDGIVQQVDTPQNLYNTPCNLFVAGFIGSPQMNFLDAEVKVNGQDVSLTIGEHVLKVPASKKQALIDGGYDGKTVVLGIRPEDVHDSEAFISNSPDSVVKSQIKVYELLGAEVYLYFDVEGTQMTARVNPRTTLRTGDDAVFALDMEKIHLFDKETELTITN